MPFNAAWAPEAGETFSVEEGVEPQLPRAVRGRLLARWVGTDPVVLTLEMGVLPEDHLRAGVDLLVRLVEAAGAIVIFIGAVVAVVQFLRLLPQRDPQRFTGVRLSLGRFLALGLEFQLASDVLRTAIAPSFEELGKLAAVAAIRTALNFFLAREIAREEEAQASARPTPNPP